MHPGAEWRHLLPSKLWSTSENSWQASGSEMVETISYLSNSLCGVSQNMKKAKPEAGRKFYSDNVI